jgi:hypothetical protein
VAAEASVPDVVAVVAVAADPGSAANRAGK